MLLALGMLGARAYRESASSKLLGHGSVKTTWDIYHHLLEGDPEKAVAKLPYANGNGHGEAANGTTTSQASQGSSELIA